MIGLLDKGRIGALTLLDLSAAFDSLDHPVQELVRRTTELYGCDSLAVISDWCAAKRLRGQRRPPQDNMSFMIDGSVIELMMTVFYDLCVLFDTELSMRDDAPFLSQTCFYRLRRLRSARQELSHDVTSLD